MPVSNNASYIPAMGEFLAHWAQVDAALPTPLVVLNTQKVAYSRAGFADLRDLIQEQAFKVIDALTEEQLGRGDIVLRKTRMRSWLMEFNGLVDVYWTGTRYLSARPKAPNPTDGEERFVAPLRDVATLWVRLDAAAAPDGVTLPLTLSDGTTQAGFALALAELQAAYATAARLAQDATLERAERDLHQRSAYATLKAYRLAVPARAVQFPALVATMPVLTPAGGHTPDAVKASALFEMPDQARVAYEASEDAALDHYELRGNPGGRYDEADAVTVARHTPEEAREFLTGFSLTQPGAQVAFKVYVVLKTGNEAGSAAMVVERPG